ncbi:tripartite tricarboxylate transporter TctB family protein [Billgrantia kenyensis]|uniref:Tripartite tricarboxylate transporter TctB family protein n=1 Tax=Billgrantia kenyensis TaxID=321266 RepID=A0A7V9VYJ3_9GAMM|nr:tripartite tricarboxylate transporter TctB family protein [Halomonas kenyensis]MBA2777757.1 tripartite tricarboxylate transporter TctB family protein [Halomonas kenyensis]MCG6660427.1 tripartite tricarboxylate transporter TctB family protein [Halomonas kenyensis]
MYAKKRDYGDLLVLMALAGFTLWYLMDAIRVSSAIQNLLLILPLSLLVLGIVLLEVVLRLKQGTLLTRPGDEAEPLHRTLPVVGLFAAYVISLETLGFDVATVLFIALFLLMKGERNWLLLIGFSLAFGFGTAFFFAYMLPYPMPMLLLEG